MVNGIQGVQGYSVLENLGGPLELAIALIRRSQLPDSMAPTRIDLQRLFQRLHFRRMMMSRLMNACQIKPEPRQQGKAGRSFVGAEERFLITAHLGALLNDGRMGVP